MFTAAPAQFFVAKLSVGRAHRGLLLLSPANDAGPHSIRQPGNESDAALSNGETLQGSEFFEPIGDAANSVLRSVMKKKAGSPRGQGGNPQAPGNTAPQGGFARRSGVS